jgi:hypothetical protein
MLRGEETHWICMNRACGATAACDETDRALNTRACRCGQLMRKEAQPAVFSYLNFLREEESGETPCER